MLNIGTAPTLSLSPHPHKHPHPFDGLPSVVVFYVLRLYAECVHRTAYRKVFFRKIHYSRHNCKGSLRLYSLPIVSQYSPCTCAVFRVAELKKKYFLSDGVAVATSFLLKKKSKKKKIFDFILNFQKKNLTKLASLTNCHIFVGQNV